MRKSEGISGAREILHAGREIIPAERLDGGVAGRWMIRGIFLGNERREAGK